MTTIFSPIDGQAMQTIVDTTPEELERVLTLAVKASTVWRNVDAERRGHILLDVARRIRDQEVDIAQIETLNTGKLPADTLREARRATACFEYYGGYADKAVGTVIPVSHHLHTYTKREPYGLVAGIIPWNVPYFFAAKKIAPALSFGNVIVLKPAAETPLTALMLIGTVQDVLEEHGFPREIAQIVTGGPDLGRALVGDPRTKLVVFTGSDSAGAAVGASAAGHFAPAVLELGGKSPQLVFADADLAAAADGVVSGIVGGCGQTCIAGSRLAVHIDVYDEFLGRIADIVTNLRVGDPRVTGTQVGPQVTHTQAEKTRSVVEKTRGSKEATIAAQSSLPDDPALAGGYWVAPTVFVDLVPEAAIRDLEVFGPVLNVDKFTSDAEAIQLGNDSRFGLSAGVWTSDLGRAHHMANQLNVGTVWLNTYRTLSDKVPFGGVGHSGYGREGGTDAVNTYTWTKSVWTELDPSPRG